MTENASPEGTGSIGNEPNIQQFEQEEALAAERAEKLRKIISEAKQNVAYHSGETIVRGSFNEVSFYVLGNENGYQIAMICTETAVHIDIALDGTIKKSEECPQNPIIAPEIQDQVQEELLRGVNRFAQPYINVDGLINVIESEIG
jgi:hypothetical protein